jgi:putative molybdopterin biosynthesis protein
MNDSTNQKQFLNVIDRDLAEKLFQAELNMFALDSEIISLDQALGRVLSVDIKAPIDVPGFDRSNVDGFALKAEDTFGASEDSIKSLKIGSEDIVTGFQPKSLVEYNFALPIATGGMLPRGADAIVMIEHTDFKNDRLLIRRAIAPGANISFAGTDISKGEIVLRKGEVLSSRETGVLAALGINMVSVVRKPIVAIFSTGNEIIAPGMLLPLGCVYDSNSTVLADAVRELGCEAVCLGIIKDNWENLKTTLDSCLKYDAILLSGGTSKGGGDLSYKVVAELGKPGIVAHGIALKPGKPLCLAVVNHLDRKVPVVVLPGFPTSAIFTFQEFVAPVLNCMAGKFIQNKKTIKAVLPFRVNSERGRTEFLLVGLVQNNPKDQSEKSIAPSFSAYPMGKGSGSVTSFANADGFIVIPKKNEYLEANEIVDVHLLGKEIEPAALVIIGSHCIGLDYLIGKLRDVGITAKFLSVGSTGGLEAIKRNECDIAGIHLLDEQSNTYNQPFLNNEIELIKGYGRLQGFVFRPDDQRFASKDLAEAIYIATHQSDLLMVNRNRGSGTRILIDRLLENTRPNGYLAEVKSHTAVVASILQKRSDWGIAIQSAVENTDLCFIPIAEEQYDFIIPKSRIKRSEILTFLSLLRSEIVIKALNQFGLKTYD